LFGIKLVLIDENSFHNIDFMLSPGPLQQECIAACERSRRVEVSASEAWSGMYGLGVAGCCDSRLMAAP
jgi:hypothetical protein